MYHSIYDGQQWVSNDLIGSIVNMAYEAHLTLIPLIVLAQFADGEVRRSWLQASHRSRQDLGTCIVEVNAVSVNHQLIRLGMRHKFTFSAC